MSVTMKVEPAELATINSIAKFSGRSRSDVMREMLSYGLAHVMAGAFGEGASDAVETVELGADEAAVVDALSAAGHGSREDVVREAIERGLEGVEHAPEELLTERQARVLACMRREPPASTRDIAAELGVSTALVNRAYHELADLGLVEKRGGRWVAGER